MSVRGWRIALLAFCAVCTAINARSLFTDAIEASSALGFEAERVPDPGFVRISSVDPGGAAQNSGLRAGDLIDLRVLSASARYRILTGVAPYERIPLTISRNAQTVHVVFHAGGKPTWRWDIWLFCASSFWLIAFAVLIAWRRADSAEARVLCVLLALFDAATGLQPGSWLTPSPFADMLTGVLGNALVWVDVALLATYAALFAHPLSAWRQTLTLSAYAAAGGIALYLGVRLVLAWNGGEPWVAQTYGPDWNFGWGALPYLLGVACAWAAIAATRGEERSRIAWTTASLGPAFIVQGAGFLVPLFLPSTARGEALLSAYAVFNVASLLAPLGMTYALFNRRLLDIGFALNRAAIFSGVSLVLVGIFILVEWLLSDWLQRASHSANLAVAAALALLLGLSIRFVQTRVEHVVDNVFFRKRRQDEEAIIALAREAPYITESSMLLARTRSVLSEHADASSVAILLDDDAGSYGGVDENDPALVALRARHTVLDLHTLKSAIAGEFAYPMVARGRLIGALVLGVKRSGESYAPDESRAIEQLAHSVAGALDVLSTVQGGEPMQRGALEEVRAATQALLRSMGELQQRVDEALSARTTT